jgi:DNA-binding NtrC family response regulator
MTETTICALSWGALRKEFAVITAQTIEKAKELLDDTTQVVLIDVRLSEDDENNRDGLIFLKWAKERFPETPMIMMSAYTDFDSAVEANNSGASFFLKKPIDLPELRKLLRRFGAGGNSQLESGEGRSSTE